MGSGLDIEGYRGSGLAITHCGGSSVGFTGLCAASQIDPHTFSEPQITHPANGVLQFNI